MFEVTKVDPYIKADIKCCFCGSGIQFRYSIPDCLLSGNVLKSMALQVTVNRLPLVIEGIRDKLVWVWSVSMETIWAIGGIIPDWSPTREHHLVLNE